MKKAYMLRLEPGNSCGPYEFIPALEKTFRIRFAAGTVSEEELSALKEPRTLQIRRLVRGRVPDRIGMTTGPFVISPKMREFLDAHEPGVHRYFPIRITTARPQNGTTEHGVHWLLFPPAYRLPEL